MRWRQLYEETLNLLGLRKPRDRNPGIGCYSGWTGVAKLKPHLKHSLISTTWELSCPDQAAGSLLSSPAMLFPAALLWETPVSLMVSLRDTESQVPGIVPCWSPGYHHTYFDLDPVLPKPQSKQLKTVSATSDTDPTQRPTKYQDNTSLNPLPAILS